LVVVAVGDSRGSWLEVDPLDVLWADVLPVDVPGPRLPSEPVPLLGEEELLGPSEPVLSA
jgi:hypothetical protein